MSAALEKSLDEIIGEKKPDSSRSSIRRDTRGRQAPYSRDRRARYEDREERDSDRHRWDHDRYSPRLSRRDDRPSYRRSPSRERDATLRVSNVHYELTESELCDLFDRLAPVVRFHLKKDRSGRSEGICFVTYGSFRDAKRAISEYDGQNALGQKLVVEFDDAPPAAPRGMDLASRISRPKAMEGDQIPSRPRSDRPRGGRGRGARRAEPARKRGPVSAADLDAELDSFMSQRNGGQAADATAETNHMDGMQLD